MARPRRPAGRGAVIGRGRELGAQGEPLLHAEAMLLVDDGEAEAAVAALRGVQPHKGLADAGQVLGGDAAAAQLAALGALGAARREAVPVGLGEAPVLRQATLSLWDDTAAMNAYARHGAHQQAIATSYRGNFFSESMFVRFVPLEVRGVWQGRRHG